MSWTECFPVLTEEMIEDYETAVTAQERSELEAWFTVKKVVNRRRSPHIVAFSLFWKHPNKKDGELPRLNRQLLMTAEEKGLVKRFAPWSHYVEPLLQGAALLRESRPEVAFRVYLAADLEFLIPDLTDVGCEVYLMETSSICHNPGAMWRFLALAERSKLVTISDSDRAPKVEADIQRTELMSKIGLGFWRVPVWGDLNDRGMMAYRPILGCQFGISKGIRIKTMMQALIWNTMKGSISTDCTPPGCGPQTVYGSKWPDYGFDEWFLQTSLYPRVAERGILSFIPANAKSRLLPLDIEYCTWSNPRSEIIYFGANGGCCGGQGLPTDRFQHNPKATVKTAIRHDIIAYTYRHGCGLGEAAEKNIQMMRDLGLSVEQRIWNNELINETALNDPEQLYYHHWHPQPCDKGQRLPRQFFGEARHIAYYAYETNYLPPEFHMAAHVMGEIWVPSSYCVNIFRDLGRPVHVVPHAVDSGIGWGADRQILRSKESPLTILFLFDAWSRLARKNPAAVIRVFQEAFPDPSEARLIIKSHHLSPGELYDLHRLCGRNHWITIIDDYLSLQDLHNLFSGADMLLSLQRSEGFGLNLAKAQSYGIPVVTTSYGGHLDFCKDIAFLVDYELEDASKYNDPWYAGGSWAEPNEAHAVTLVRNVADQIKSNSPVLAERTAKGQRIISENFSDSALRARIEARLRGYFTRSPRFESNQMVIPLAPHRPEAPLLVCK